MTKPEFVELLFPLTAEYVNYPLRQLITAHAAFESGWGVAKAFREGNNPFNLTLSSKLTGKMVLGPDTEFDKSGLSKPITQRFIAYESIASSIPGYLAFLSRPRYLAAKNALEVGDVEGFANGLKAGGYFTAPLEQYRAGLKACLRAVQQLTGDQHMADPNMIDPLASPSVSPTGAPVIPPHVIPVLGALVALAGVGAQFLPSNTIVAHICSAILSFSGLLGMFSPGLRK